MSKLEELKAAYVATGGGMSEDDADLIPTADCTFYDLAHNLMPTLLEAIDLLEDVALGNSEYDDLSAQAAELLEKLR